MNIRPVTTADAENVGQIMYKAFRLIADRHNFPHDFPSIESAMEITGIAINDPDVVGFVAEDEGGRFLGSNFLWKHNRIAGVGPITVDPEAQARGVGRTLMQAVIEAGRDAAGIRLVQDAFNTVSLPLYAGLGFDVVEPLVIMQGTPKDKPSRETKVRLLEGKDFPACAEMCQTIHGFDRSRELEQFSQVFPAFVAEREGRIVAYASAPTLWQMNHAVSETTEEMQNLLVGAAHLAEQPLAFLLPIRQAKLFRWCLSQGLRVVKPMNLMTMGAYQEPRGCFLPSVMY
jgi:GNAT superfamily N-acetyltransferase